jgi:phosphotransferase system  glucose/maltose/N-acetylglucosamine-specific IIC component
LYLFYLIPVIPACGIFLHLASITDPDAHFGFELPEGILLNIDFISYPVSWLFLVISIPFWFYTYIYLD